jgi:hypothetical protein
VDGEAPVQLKLFEKISSFCSNPDAGDILARALEDEILPIGSPAAATFT